MRRDGSVFWQGFAFTWQRTPHRLNHLGNWLEGLSHDGGGPKGRAVSRLTVGRVPDTGIVRTYLAGLACADVRFVDGTVELEIGAAVGEAALRDGPRVDLPLDGADPRTATVVLRGFDLVCTSHTAGVHMQGLGARLKDIRCADGTLSFVPELFLQANNSPDPLTTWRGGFSYRMSLHYTAVLPAPRAAACTLSPHDRACVEIDHGKRPPGLLPRVVQGQEGFDSGVLGLRGFRFDQLHRGRWARDGRYLRQFHVQIRDPVYDPRSGRLLWHPHAWFSNAGVVAYPVRVAHRLWTTLLQFRGPCEARHHVVEHQFGTGLSGQTQERPFALPLPDLALAG